MPLTHLTPLEMEKDGPDGLKIQWSDGHLSSYKFADLRKACPCASCRGTHEERPSGSLSLFVLPDNATDLLSPSEIVPVGRYAYTIVWKDGHSAGIYSYDYLRQLCQCSECSGNKSGSQPDRTAGMKK
jgi:DUF971 family protein